MLKYSIAHLILGGHRREDACATAGRIEGCLSSALLANDRCPGTSAARVGGCPRLIENFYAHLGASRAHGLFHIRGESPGTRLRFWYRSIGTHVWCGRIPFAIMVFMQPEESPFFLAEPRTSMERLMSPHSSRRIRGASSTGLPDIAALIIRAPSKGCPAHVDVVQLLLDKGVEDNQARKDCATPQRWTSPSWSRPGPAARGRATARASPPFCC